MQEKNKTIYIRCNLEQPWKTFLLGNFMWITELHFLVLFILMLVVKSLVTYKYVEMIGDPGLLVYSK